MPSKPGDSVARNLMIVAWNQLDFTRDKTKDRVKISWTQIYLVILRRKPRDRRQLIRHQTGRNHLHELRGKTKDRVETSRTQIDPVILPGGKPKDRVETQTS